MQNISVTFIILSILALAIYKLVTEKRKGVKCVGCALSGGCSSKKTAINKRAAQQISIKQLL